MLKWFLCGCRLQFKSLVSGKWFFLFLSVAWTALLYFPLGPLPQGLGPLLDYQTGIWAHRLFQWQDQIVPGLKEKVHVAIDAKGVPHIFAGNTADLFMAQGYVVASQRLFQMDLTSRVTEGRLTELVGAKAAVADRFFVKFGMRQSLAKALSDYEADPRTQQVFSSFVQGVNAQIRQLENLPPEYRILGRRPELFSERRLVNYARAITFSLSGRSYDLYLTQVQKKLGTAAALDLFPEFLPREYEDFVIPSQGAGNSLTSKAVDSFVTDFEKFPETLQPFASNGSNNWAVGPSRSLTGKSLMANDTHLGLSLPNVWFETQLSCPEFNVYGVAMPALPGILAGMNSSVAWGLTNGGTDALDWYQIEFENNESLNYRFNGQWIPAEKFSEKISGPRGAMETVDVVWTKYGVLLHREGRKGLVAHWLGHEMGNSMSIALDLFSSSTASECVRALKRWESPSQNYICADHKNIALVFAGAMPERKSGEGRFVQKADQFLAPLSKRIPESSRPRDINPPQGMVGSSNQRIMGPDYPYNLGWDFEDPFRGRQVRRLLNDSPQHSPQDFIRILTDDLDPQAELALPLLLKLVNREDLSEQQAASIRSLATWDYRAKAQDKTPMIYKAWWLQLKKELFLDDYPQPERKFFPKDMRILWLLKRVIADSADSDAQWVDDRSTDKKENLNEIITRAFVKSWTELEDQHGRNSEKWKWGDWVRTEWPHIARFPGFGSQVLSVDGAGESVRAVKGKHGAVYKAVFELGDWPRAWMHAPGGTSGDPFAKDFGQGLQDWASGEMQEVEFYRDLAEAKSRAVKVIELHPEVTQ